MRLALAVFLLAVVIVLVAVFTVVDGRNDGGGDALDAVPCPTTYTVAGCP